MVVASGIEEQIAAGYRQWAHLQARQRSPLYDQVCQLVAGDDDLLAFLAGMPGPKRQPNLFFAAVQYLFGVPATAEQFRALVLEHREQVAAIMATRTTQTNQPARCATLLPAMAQINGPLALLEVGASAGLCLLPDRYDYLFTDASRPGSAVPRRTGRPRPPAPQFTCATNAATPHPARPIDIAWRAGLDLNPLDVTDADTRAWLDALIWSGEEHVRANFHRALDIAAADPPAVHRGNLLHDLPDLAAQAPDDATLVVFHTAVLTYLPDRADREHFAAEIAHLRRQRRTVWLANESPVRIPGLTPAMVQTHPASEFLLCRNGDPVARTDPHGGFITWLGEQG